MIRTHIGHINNNTPAHCSLNFLQRQHHHHHRRRHLVGSFPVPAAASTTTTTTAAATTSRDIPSPATHQYQSQQSQQHTLKNNPLPSTLQNPAQLGGTTSVSIPVIDRGHPHSLTTYMFLPPSQYSALDPDLIQPLGNDKFRLHVPKVELFSLWIQPIVDVTVIGADEKSPRVLLRSESCRLKGSRIVGALEKKFHIQFETELTWIEGVVGSDNAETTTSPSSSPSQSGEMGSIAANLALAVHTEVIPPFHLLPREFLVNTANTVLSKLMASLLPLFLKKLGADYERWSMDQGYRHTRAQLTPEIEYNTMQ